MSTAALTPEWRAFVEGAWPSLVRRGRVCAPAGLPHPSLAGWERPWLSEPAGQVADWTLSLGDGSRLHAHEYADGGLVVHRDALDPSQGVGRAVGHALTETSLGKTAVLGLAGFGLAHLVARLGFGFSSGPLRTVMGVLT